MHPPTTLLPLEAWWNPVSWQAPFAVIVAGLFVVVLLRAGGTYLLGRLLRRGSERGHRDAARPGLTDRVGFVRAEQALNTWGAPAVTLAFLTIGVQTMVNLAAGFTRMPLRRYLPALLLGCLAWAMIYASAGFVGISAVMVLWRIHPVLAITLLAAAAVGIGLLVRSQLQHN